MKNLTYVLSNLRPLTRSGLLALAVLSLALLGSHLLPEQEEKTVSVKVLIQSWGIWLSIVVGLTSQLLHYCKYANPDFLTKNEKEFLVHFEKGYTEITFDDAVNLIGCENSLIRLEDKGYIKFYEKTDSVVLEAKGRDFIVLQK